MADTLYSHQLRILSCGNCMAPLETNVGGGRFSCAYCGALSEFARRDEGADLAAAHSAAQSAMPESERYARLRDQDRQPAPIPERIEYLLTRGKLSEDTVEEAENGWREALRDLSVSNSFPVCERLFHLSVLLAPWVDERRRRAMLETTLERLPDPGHRQVLRCMLGKEAARLGDTQSAQSWLAAVNPVPVDLTLHTLYRLAAATLATADGDFRRVVDLLGLNDDDVPLLDRYELDCALLRNNALAGLGHQESANAFMLEASREHGTQDVRRALDAQLPLRLCERAFGLAESVVDKERAREDIARLTQELKNPRVERLTLSHAVLILVFLIGPMSAALACIVGAVLTDFTALDPHPDRFFTLSMKSAVGTVPFTTILVGIRLFFAGRSRARGRAPIEAKLDAARAKLR